MEQMTAHDYERLVKLIALLASDNDGEVLNAVAAASRILSGYGLDWTDVILPRRLMPIRASAAGDVAEDDDGTIRFYLDAELRLGGVLRSLLYLSSG